MKNTTALAGTTLTFRRGATQLRPFEVEALKTVPGLGYFYSDLTGLGVEAQMTRPVPVSEDTVTVFFKLTARDGWEYIEIQHPLLPGIYTNMGYIWPSNDGTVNATITGDIVNGYYVITSLIDGVHVRFEFDPIIGLFVPVEELARAKALEFAAQRLRVNAA